MHLTSHGQNPYVTGKTGYPPPNPTVGGGVMSLLAGLYPRGPVDITSHARLLPKDGHDSRIP